MATRTYDKKLTLNSAIGLEYLAYKVTTNTAEGVITNIKGNDIYVRKFSDADFVVNDTITIQQDTLSGSYSNPETTEDFTPRAKTGSTNLVSRTITNIEQNKFLTETRSSEMSDIIRLISIYYPGEWYSDNKELPNNSRAWPHLFPMRFCTAGFSEQEIDSVTPETYPVEFDGIEYLPIPIDMADISEDSDGKINKFSISIFNVDNMVNAIINNPNLAGYSSEGISITVDGQTITGIDARTVPGNSAYNPAIVNYYGTTNATIDKRQNDLLGGTWTQVKEDSRHLLGAVVKITSTFQRFLKYWPEYSTITSNPNNNTVNVKDAVVYRVGDKVRTSSNSTTATITSITNNSVIYLDSNIQGIIGDRLYIVNPDGDTAASVTEVFTIDKLEGIKQDVVTFELSSFLQFFTRKIPRERYFRNNCRFKYKDARCGYRGPGDYIIRGTSNRRANPKAVTIANEETTDLTKDQCAKTLEACQLRGNDYNYGGFISVR